jgi:hypothetical protein
VNFRGNLGEVWENFEQDMASLLDSLLRRGRGLLLRSRNSSSKRMAVMETRTGELLLGLVSRGQALVAELLHPHKSNACDVEGMATLP